MTPALALAVLLAPLGPREAALHLAGGFTVLDVIPALPPAPLLTGELQLALGLGAGLELRGRYATHLGVVHRLGPDLRARVWQDETWLVGLRLHPSVSLGGNAADGIDVAGDVATQAALVVAWGDGRRALALEAGATVQWLLYEDVGGRSHVDDVPYLAFVDVALHGEWRLASGTRLLARLELAVPRAPDDPFAVLGVYPRALMGVVLPLGGGSRGGGPAP